MGSRLTGTSLAIALSLSVSFALCKTLQGGVQHTEQLAPLPEQLRQGSVFHEPQERRMTVEWFRVPKWLVGEWQSSEIRTVSCFENGKGEMLKSPVVEPLQSREQFGTQTDRKGGIWSDLMFPRRNRPQTGNGFTLEQSIVAGRCLESSKEHLILFLQTRNWRISNGNGKIVEAFQGESINTYSPLSGGKVLVEASNRKYDEDGNPISTTVTRNIDNNVGPFTPLAAKRGVDLRQSLADYLLHNGYQDLVPDGAL